MNPTQIPLVPQTRNTDHGPRPPARRTRGPLTVALLVAVSLVATACGPAADQNSSLVDRASDEAEGVVEQLAVESASGSETPSGDSKPACVPLDPAISSLVIAPPWQVGATRQLEVTTSVTGSGNPPVEYEVELLVADEGSSGWQFSTEAFVLDLLSLTSLPDGNGRESAIGAVEPLKFRYRIGPDGVWLGLDDPAIVQAEVVAQLPSIWQAVPAIYDALDQIQREVAAMSPDEFGNNSRTALTWSIYHLFEGFELVGLGEGPDEFQIFNPYGGPPLPGRVETFEGDLAGAGGCVAVELVVRLEETQGTELLLDSMRVRFPDADQSVLQQASESVELTESYLAIYDPTTGFLREFTFSKTISLDDVELVDTTRIVDISETQ